MRAHSPAVHARDSGRDGDLEPARKRTNSPETAGEFRPGRAADSGLEPTSVTDDSTRDSASTKGTVAAIAVPVCSPSDAVTKGRRASITEGDEAHSLSTMAAQELGGLTGEDRDRHEDSVEARVSGRWAANKALSSMASGAVAGCCVRDRNTGSKWDAGAAGSVSRSSMPGKLTAAPHRRWRHAVKHGLVTVPGTGADPEPSEKKLDCNVEPVSDRPDSLTGCSPRVYRVRRKRVQAVGAATGRDTGTLLAFGSGGMSRQANGTQPSPGLEPNTNTRWGYCRLVPVGTGMGPPYAKLNSMLRNTTG